MSKEFQRYVVTRVKRAIVDYGMIADGDRVAVGLSGGKDSSVLLHILNLVRRVAPIKFSLHGIYVDPGWDMEVNVLREFCEHEGVPFYYKPTNIAEVVFDIRQEKNPCALCANLRRGALNNTARDLGCNKVALGHHLDDVIETFFMSLFYTGQFRTFSPITYLSRSDVTMIRPLIYLTQEHVREMARQKNLPVLENPCPVNGKTKRQEMREFVANLLIRYPELHLRFLNALKTADLRNLWPVTK
ncbi:tRNA 2-thiocytidine biosynthesis protein TtcA [Desulfofundulus sp. TPOSR]|uniref:tRNA lysidine(34) synthetase n=1 Tax=Desulfofundulus sp. TPOSR TaxID=2714340 RepID=UPI00140968D2|nr:tRNA 2-thiocytidine biosynthesis TtcA family protein [Desulfofundulus sp. TPOSR]NHM27541.1 tRNA 2-thiocytidine biosynthesis protein TtcA [Desulfofundulus sp. TPOSR]